MAACMSVLLAAVSATDYEEGSFAGLAPKATAHFADEFDARRGLRKPCSASVARIIDAPLAAAFPSLLAVAVNDGKLVMCGTHSCLASR